ncbi:uracil-DNA glycosylase [Parvularcula marina]|nr:uracil-DNA glycosylase [Parvularcula marina]
MAEPSLPAEPPRDCPLCPRLAEFRAATAVEHPDWFNGAVPSFAAAGGDETVRVLIVGLAPGLQGANRTGRPFTGDWAGDLLYATLLDHGLARGVYDQRPDDGLELIGTMITNAVRCVPPQNKPTGPEINQCRPFLIRRIETLPNLEVMIALGKIAHDSVIRAMGAKLKDHPFGHGTEYQLEGPNGPLRLLSSYHCSRYNTNTGRLTPEMFADVFRMI